MTRAKDRLVLTWARARRSFGRESFEGTKPSRFMKEIPEELLEPLSSTMLPLKQRTTWENAVNSLESVNRFLNERGHSTKRGLASHGTSIDRPAGYGRWELGTQVRHPKYGLGTILECEGEGEETKLTVSFPDYGLKKLLERFASLEKA